MLAVIKLDTVIFKHKKLSSITQSHNILVDGSLIVDLRTYNDGT